MNRGLRATRNRGKVSVVASTQVDGLGQRGTRVQDHRVSPLAAGVGGGGAVEGEGSGAGQIKVGVLLDERWSKLLPLTASCPHKKARRTQRLTTWYQGVSASEIRDERGRVMGRSLKNAVYLGN